MSGWDKGLKKGTSVPKEGNKLFLELTLSFSCSSGLGKKVERNLWDFPVSFPIQIWLVLNSFLRDLFLLLFIIFYFLFPRRNKQTKKKSIFMQIYLRWHSFFLGFPTAHLIRVGIFQIWVNSCCFTTFSYLS